MKIAGGGRRINAAIKWKKPRGISFDLNSFLFWRPREMFEKASAVETSRVSNSCREDRGPDGIALFISWFGSQPATAKPGMRLHQDELQLPSHKKGENDF